MHRSQIILLSPTKDQLRLLNGSVGLSRFAWNWGLAIWKRHFRMFGKTPGFKGLTAYRLRKRWNAVKDKRFPWVRDYSKQIPETSLLLLGKSYQDSFSRIRAGKAGNFPVFHKKGVHESFQVVPSASDQMPRKGRRFLVPRIGMVKCVTPIRWPNSKQVNGRIMRRAGRWWLMLAYELPDMEKLPSGRPTCGVDLGCKTFATIASNGEITTVESLKPYAKAKRKLQRLQRMLSRRTKGGKNRRKAIIRVAKWHERIANLRDNHLHQCTSRLVKKYGVIVLEDLSVKGMAGGMLAGTIHDLGFGEFRRQVEYKAEAAGTKVVFANRFYPSSKTCCRCGQIKDELPLAERTYRCDCGNVMDRDENAAINLEALGQGMPESTPTETGVQVKRKLIRSRSKKQESSGPCPSECPGNRRGSHL